jgi:hypothetical protein
MRLWDGDQDKDSGASRYLITQLCYYRGWVGMCGHELETKGTE